jgi:predicted HTH transcriptional regulator
MEIQNPGMLSFGMTMEDFMDVVNKVRNRVIVCVFQEPGLMEEWKADIEGNWQHGVEAEF